MLSTPVKVWARPVLAAWPSLHAGSPTLPARRRESSAPDSTSWPLSLGGAAHEVRIARTSCDERACAASSRSAAAAAAADVNFSSSVNAVRGWRWHCSPGEDGGGGCGGCAHQTRLW